MLITAIKQNFKGNSHNKNNLNIATKPRVNTDVVSISFKGKSIPKDFVTPNELSKVKNTETSHTIKKIAKNSIIKINEGMQNLFKIVKNKIPTKTNKLISKALKNFEQGNDKEAEELFNKAVEINPKNPRPLYQRGSFYVATGKYSQALDDLTKSEKLDPTNLHNIFLKGVACFSLNKPAEAMECFDKVLKKHPKDMEVLLNKAELHEINHEFDPAIETYSKIIELDNRDVISLAKRATLNEKIENTSLADKDINEVFKFKPEDLAETMDKGQAFLLLNKNFEALGEFKKSLNLTKIAVLNGDIENKNLADKDFDEINKLIPEDFKKVMIEDPLEANKNLETREDLQRILDKVPDDPNILAYMGDAYAKEAFRGDPRDKETFIKKALDTYQKGIDKNPKDVTCLFAKADFYLDLDKPEKAIEGYNAIFKIDDNNIEALYAKGNVCKKIGDNASTAECFKKITELDSSDIEAKLNLANAYADMGEDDKAIGHYDEILKVDTKSQIAEFALTSKGYIYLDKAEDKLALDNFNAALKINPKNPACYASRAFIFSESYNNELALKNINVAEKFLKEPNAVEVPEFESIKMLISQRMINEANGKNYLYKRGTVEIAETETSETHTPEDLLKGDEGTTYDPEELLKEETYKPWSPEDEKNSWGDTKDPNKPWKDIEDEDENPDDLQLN